MNETKLTRRHTFCRRPSLNEYHIRGVHLTYLVEQTGMKISAAKTKSLEIRKSDTAINLGNTPI